MASDTRPPVVNGKVREKVALQAGFHLADWMRLTSVATNLSGRKEGEPLRKISHKELAEHSSEFDCWTAYQGKVYNITQYLPYHPGGSKKLMLGAGKDCTELFDRYHRWVNIASIMSKCVVGTLIEEQNKIEEGDEEEEEDGRDAAEAKSAGDRLAGMKLGGGEADRAEEKGADSKAESK
jgi:cytochrome b involved in lipid metabolism